MSRYIDADKQKNLIDNCADLGGKLGEIITLIKRYAKDMADATPTADVVEVDKAQKEIDYWHDKAQSYEQTILKLSLNKADVVEVVRCKDCIYYDPPHVEDHGERRDYIDMPREAFDKLGTGSVNLLYGVNVGGRCCRDYNAGYSEDKRVYVSESNYCGRAERADT